MLRRNCTGYREWKVRVPQIEGETGSLYYRGSGNGPETVVLLHDFFGTHQSWFSLQSELSRYFTTISPDLRGHGRSTSRQADLSITSMVTDVERLVSHVGAERVHLVGCSHGAVIGLHLARTRPEMVRSLVVTSVPDLDDPDVIAYGRKYAATVFPRLEAELDQRHDEGRSGYSRNVLLSAFVASLDTPPDDHLAALRLAHQIQCPVLILNGDRDPVLAPERVIQLMRRLPAARLGILPDTGHLAHHESPARYAEFVLDHLWRVLAAPDPHEP